MINLRKYVAGVKDKDSNNIVWRPNALKKTEEHMMVLLIPKSELDKILEEVDNETGEGH